MSADVDVVIVAFGSRDVIGERVERVKAMPGVGRVVVVDNGDDGSGAVAAAAGATVVEQPWNPGFGAGQNVGVRATSAPFALLLNPDAELEPKAAAAGAAFLRDHSDVGAVQGAILGWSGEAERSQGRELGPLHLWGRALGARRALRLSPVRAAARRVPTLADHADRVPEGPTDVAALAATALLVRRAAFDAVGGFDESYFLYGEDLDLARRLRGSGWRLVALPDVWARHESGGSAASWWDRELSWWQGTMVFAARWWRRPSWTAALAAAVVRWMILAVKRPRSAGEAWQALISKPRRRRRATAVAR